MNKNQSNQCFLADGGHNRDRTCDPYHVKAWNEIFAVAKKSIKSLINKGITAFLDNSLSTAKHQNKTRKPNTFVGKVLGEINPRIMAAGFQ